MAKIKSNRRAAASHWAPGHLSAVPYDHGIRSLSRSAACASWMTARHACRVADLTPWTGRLRASVTGLMDGFEGRFGYLPDANLVVAARHPGGTIMRTRLEGRVQVPSAIVDFFDAIEEVSLPDVWNGYFLGPADRVVAAHAEESARWITIESELQEVLLIGSDGGGALYCASVAEPAPVFRVEEPSIRHGVATGLSGDVRPLASSFPAFLEALADAVEASAQGRETPPF